MEPEGDHKRRHKKQRLKEQRLAEWYEQHGMYYERKKKMGFRPIVGESGITYNVEKREGVISTMSNGWKKELNKVAWNDGEAKFEIRSWSKDHQRMGKGISFTEEELVTLANILAKMDCVKGKIVV